MKYLLLALSLLLVQVAHAQAPATATAAVSPAYCMLLVSTSFNTTNYTSLYLDYGQNQRGVLAIQDADLARLAEQVRHYTSIPAALSYLTTQGWEFVEATTLTVAHETHTTYQDGQIGYLLRRKP